jgi:hypothetical protein
VAIHWSPLPVERLLIGRSADDANALIPAALALCHQAHCAAAQRALDAAAPPETRGVASSAAAYAVRDARVRLEAGRETLRRWLLDFPAAFGEHWPEGTLTQWPRLDTLDALAGFCAVHVYGDLTAAQWLDLDEGGQRDWAARGATLPARWLRALLQDADRPVTAEPASVLAYARQRAPELIAGIPLFADSPLRTNPWRERLPNLIRIKAIDNPAHAELWAAYADPWAAPIVLPDLASGLLIARLRHLARICAHGQDQDAAATPAVTPVSTPVSGSERQGDIGIGWAQTARGLLVHLARVEQGRVAAYRIIAPTYWNFGASTLLTPALAGRPWPEARRRFARLALLLDPCVPFEIRPAHQAEPEGTRHA